MPGKVILNVTGGELAGTRYRFDSRMICMIGRADTCSIQFTGTAGDGVSRHHCLLYLDPPRASIQDLGSRNGTFLNDRDIGVAAENPGPDGKPAAYPLSDGDSIRIANNVFRVSLAAPVKCYVCHRLLPDDSAADPRSGHVICPECEAAGLQFPILPASKTLKVRTCVVCGANVTLPPDSDSDEAVDDPFVCADCRLRNTDPNSTFRIPEKNSLSSSLFSLPGYRILRRIGRGGMGDVYLGQDCETLEKVAVKVLRPEIASLDTCREDFLREAENLKPLRHPNIVELKACRGDDAAIYLILEYCSGGTLRNYLHSGGKTFDVRTALDLACQILDALDYAHGVRLVQRSLLDDREYVLNGLVHRDIKPENIFLCENEGILTAKISDFGLAKAFSLAGISGCTQTGDFSGTLGFVCKQQYINYKYVRPEVDVWAAAATLFYMLTGCAPRDFSHGEPGEVFERKPARVERLNPEIPLPLAEVINSALDDSGSLRFKTASALKCAIEDAAAKIG